MVGELEKTKSKWIIAAIVIIAVVLLGAAYYWFFATEQVTGNVDHKSISGYKDGTGYTLVMCTPYGLNVNQDVSDLFAGMDTNMTVSADLEKELQNRGYEIHYIGNIVVSSPDNVNGQKPGDANGYFVSSRDVFNRLVLGNDVTIDVAHDQKNTIRGVH